MTPWERLLEAVAVHHQAADAGDMPMPRYPRCLARLYLERDGGDVFLVAVADDGWEYQTPLAPGENIDLLALPGRDQRLH